MSTTWSLSTRWSPPPWACLGAPGQAITYKLGERAWLAGREAARQARTRYGQAFDPKAWPMAALSQGSLRLDDLVAELSAL